MQLRALELSSPTTQTHNATPQLSKGVGSWAAFLFALGARPARSSADSPLSPLAIMLFFFSVFSLLLASCFFLLALVRCALVRCVC